jgi:hypothetical protein
MVKNALAIYLPLLLVLGAGFKYMSCATTSEAYAIPFNVKSAYK